MSNREARRAARKSASLEAAKKEDEPSSPATPAQEKNVTISEETDVQPLSPTSPAKKAAPLHEPEQAPKSEPGPEPEPKSDPETKSQPSEPMPESEQEKQEPASPAPKGKEKEKEKPALPTKKNRFSLVSSRKKEAEPPRPAEKEKGPMDRLPPDELAALVRPENQERLRALQQEQADWEAAQPSKSAEPELERQPSDKPSEPELERQSSDKATEKAKDAADKAASEQPAPRRGTSLINRFNRKSTAGKLGAQASAAAPGADDAAPATSADAPGPAAAATAAALDVRVHSFDAAAVSKLPRLLARAAAIQVGLELLGQRRRAAPLTLGKETLGGGKVHFDGGGGGGGSAATRAATASFALARGSALRLKALTTLGSQGVQDLELSFVLVALTAKEAKTAASAGAEAGAVGSEVARASLSLGKMLRDAKELDEGSLQLKASVGGESIGALAVTLRPLELLRALQAELDAFGTARLAHLSASLPPPRGLELRLDVQGVRPAAGARPPPASAASLRLVVELPHGAWTLRSALVPPTEAGLAQIRLATTVDVAGGGPLRAALYRALAAADEEESDVHFVVYAVTHAQLEAAAAAPLEGPATARAEVGQEVGSTFANLKRILAGGKELSGARLQLETDDGIVALGSLRLSLHVLPLLTALDAALKRCQYKAKDVNACEAARRKAAPPEPPPAAAPAAADGLAAAHDEAAPLFGGLPVTAAQAHECVAYTLRLAGGAPATQAAAKSRGEARARPVAVLRQQSSLDSMFKTDEEFEGVLAAAHAAATQPPPPPHLGAAAAEEEEAPVRGQSMTLDERMKAEFRVRLKLRVRGRIDCSVAAKLSIGPATAEEMLRARGLSSSLLLGAAAVGAEAAAEEAEEAAARRQRGGDAARRIEVELEELELYRARAPRCRRVQLAVDMFGFEQPEPSTEPIQLRAALGAPVACPLRHTMLVEGEARRVLSAAFATHELEDSDVDIVLRGLGGACGDGADVASAVINLERLAQGGAELRHEWLDLMPDDAAQAGGAAALGRVKLSTRALPALLALQAEAREAREAEAARGDESEPSTPHGGGAAAVGEAGWRLGVELLSFTLKTPPRLGTCYEARLSAGGRTTHSRSVRCHTGTLKLDSFPLALATEIYCGPGAACFGSLWRAAKRADAAEAEPFYDVWSGQDVAEADGLVFRLMEAAPPAATAAVPDVKELLGLAPPPPPAASSRTSSRREWRQLGGGVLPMRSLLAAPCDQVVELPMLDPTGSEAATVSLVLRSAPLLAAIRGHRGPAPPPAPLPQPQPTAPQAEPGAAAATGGGAAADEELRIEIGSLQLLPSAPSLRSIERISLEVQLGGAAGMMLRAPLTSRQLGVPGARVATHVGWARALQVARDGALGRRLRDALATADDDEPHLLVTVVGVTGGIRRNLGSARHSLRRQMLRGADAVDEPVRVEQRGQPLATLWLSVGANATLARLCPPQLAPRLPSRDEFVDSSHVAKLQLRSILRLQAYARGVVARRRRRLRACAFRQVIGFAVHELQLPAHLCTPQQVAAAGVQVELMKLGGGKDALGAAPRPRAGRSVRFDVERNVPLEPGGAAWARVSEAVRSRAVAACELRFTVTAERQLSGVSRAMLFGADAGRYVLGSLRIGLVELLRGGADLVERPLPLMLNGKLGLAGVEPPMLVVSVRAVEALAAVAASAGMPALAAGGPLRPAADIIAERARLAVRLQACARGLLVRARLHGPTEEEREQRRRAAASTLREELVLTVLGFSAAARPPSDESGAAAAAAAAAAAPPAAVGRRRAPGGAAAERQTLLSQLGAELSFRLEVDEGRLATPRRPTTDDADVAFGDLTVAARRRREPQPSRSEWLHVPGEADEPGGVVALALRRAVDMRHGGHARSVLREALLRGTPAAGHLSVSVSGTSKRSKQAATPLERTLQPHQFIETEINPGAAAQRSMAKAARAAARLGGAEGGGGAPALSDEVIELGRARVSLLELMAPPTDGLHALGQPEEVRRWVPLATPRGEVIGQIDVRVEGVQLLRLLHAANRFRQAEAFGLNADSLTAPAAARDTRDGDDDVRGGGGELDIVDELQEHLLSATSRHAATAHELCVTAFFTNPRVTELQALLPRLSGLHSLDVSYCLRLEPTLLKATLTQLDELKQLDASCCELHDAGADAIAARLLEPRCALRSVRLRANRIGRLGAASLAVALAQTATLETLDLGDNKLGMRGVAWLALGPPPPGHAVAAAAATTTKAAAAITSPRRKSRASLSPARGPRSPLGSRRRDKEPPLPQAGDGDELARLPPAVAGGGEGGGRRRRRVAAPAAAEADAPAAAQPPEGPAVAAGLKENTSLTALLLSNNAITHEALCALARALALQGKLVELDLSVNPLNNSPQPQLAAADGEAGGGGGAWWLADEDDAWRWPAAIKTFGAALARLPTLRRLQVQYNEAGAGLGRSVAAALGGGGDAPSGDATATASPAAPPRKGRGWGGLLQVNLQGSQLASGGAEALFRALGGPLGGPELLNVEGAIGSRARAALPALWEALGRPAYQCAPLQRLNLGFNQLGAAEATQLSGALRTNAWLLELDLGSNALDAEAVAELCGGLEENTRLQTLTLNFCEVGAAGARSLSELLARRECGLTDLRLDGCGLGPKGAEALAAALKSDAAKLRSLRLECNRLGDEGIGALASALGFNLTLRALHLGCNELSERSCGALASGLALNSTLHVLDLSDNAIGARGLRALLEGVRTSGSLTALDLASCGLGDAGCEPLALELATNPTLRFVRVAANEIRAAGGRALADAVETSLCSSLLLDASRNPAMVYHDVVRLRIANNARRSGAGENPLDGARGKAPDQAYIA